MMHSVKSMTMSKDMRIALSGVPLAFGVSDMSSRCYELFIFVGMFAVIFAQCFSKKYC